MDIDYNVTGADQAINKTKQLAGSVKRLESAWSRYNRAINTTKGGIGALRAGGSTGSLGGIIQGAIAFSIVQKALESMASERVKSLMSDLISSDLRRWKRLGLLMHRGTRSLSRFLTPFLVGAKNLIGGLGIMAMGVPGMLGRVAGGAAGGLKRAAFGTAAGYAAIKMGSQVGAIVRMVGSAIQFALKRTPLGLLLGIATFGMLLDERVSKWFADKAAKIGEFFTKQGELITSFWGTQWKSFRRGLARFSGNAYYAQSELNSATAQKQLTPAQQTKYIEEEMQRLRNEDAEELIRRTKIELKDYFDKMNEVQNHKFDGIVDVMRYEGRL